MREPWCSRREYRLRLAAAGSETIGPGRAGLSRDGRHDGRRHRTDQRTAATVAAAEQRTAEIVAAAEQRIAAAAEQRTTEIVTAAKDETIEAMRDMQTEILRGIERFARGNFARM